VTRDNQSSSSYLHHTEPNKLYSSIKSLANLENTIFLVPAAAGINIIFAACRMISSSAALFWLIMQTVVVIYYQHFGTTYQPQLFFFGFLTLDDGTDNLS
jgi:hypothetical protein